MIKTTLLLLFSFSLGACAHPHQGYVVYGSSNRPPLYVQSPPPTYCYPPRNYTIAPRVCNVQPWSNGYEPRPTRSGYIPPDPWAPVSAPKINAPGQRIIVPQPW